MSGSNTVGRNEHFTMKLGKLLKALGGIAGKVAQIIEIILPGKPAKPKLGKDPNQGGKP